MACATRPTCTCNCFVPHITHHSFYLFEHKNTPEYTSCTMQLMFTHFWRKTWNFKKKLETLKDLISWMTVWITLALKTGTLNSLVPSFEYRRSSRVLFFPLEPTWCTFRTRVSHIEWPQVAKTPFEIAKTVSPRCHDDAMFVCIFWGGKDIML